MKKLFLAVLLFGAASLSAADAGKRYLKLKDDSDLFVGEGVADMKEFNDDGLKTLEAAKERARAALASSIQVRITSETSEELKNGKAGTSEEISAKSKSLSDLVLENVHLEDFMDVPASGKVTVLAYVSKEDYRRQLAGKKVSVYRSQNGLRIGLFGMNLASTDKIINSKQNPPTDHRVAGGPNGLGSGSAQSSGSGGQTQGGIPVGFALEFVWRGLVVGLGFQTRDAETYILSPDKTFYYDDGHALTTAMLQLGFDWEPWAWRLQPFFPLRLELADCEFGPYFALATGAVAGAGLRYWPTDTMSFELSVRGHLGLSGSEYSDNGKILMLSENVPARFDLNGGQVLAGLTWNGF